MNRISTFTRLTKVQLQLLLLAVLVAVFFSPALGLFNQGSNFQFTPKTQEVIFEDDPRFDCKTMGNKICGPSAAVQEKG